MAVPWSVTLSATKMIWLALTGWVISCFTVADEIAASLRSGEIGPFHVNSAAVTFLRLLQQIRESLNVFATRMLRKNKTLQERMIWLVRRFSRMAPPPSSRAVPIICVSNNISHLGRPKDGPKPRQLLSLPPFPHHPLPAKNSAAPESPTTVTAISWIKYYFDDVLGSLVQSHFNKGLVQLECLPADESSIGNQQTRHLKRIKHNEIMKAGSRVYVPVSVAESRISKRFDTIPSGTLYPNADEIQYLQRLVMYKDSAIIILNKPPKLPVKGYLPVHNSMDALAAAAFSYDNDVGPKLVHRLDRESSGIIIMGRTKESISHLHWLFKDVNKAKSLSKAWNNAREATYQRYWALVIGSPQEKEGLICAPLSKVLLDDGKTERAILAHGIGLEASQEAVTEYRVLGPTINGCSWIELRPLTSCKHQIRVHCAEALGTPIVGDYKYGWFVHRRWKQMARVDFEPTTGEPYKMRRPDGLHVQKGSVLSKVPLLHLHCRELVLPNISKFLDLHNNNKILDINKMDIKHKSKPDVLRFVAPMPSHMKISWNLMSSYLV